MITTTGLDATVLWLTRSADGPARYLHLYQNDHTPALGDVLADYTEADFSGYAALDLFPDWTGPTGAGEPRVQSAGPVTFLHDGGVTGNSIYGCYLTDQAGTTLLGAIRGIGVPFDMSVLNDEISVTLTLSAENA